MLKIRRLLHCFLDDADNEVNPIDAGYANDEGCELASVYFVHIFVRG